MPALTAMNSLKPSTTMATMAHSGGSRFCAARLASCVASA